MYASRSCASCSRRRMDQLDCGDAHITHAEAADQMHEVEINHSNFLVINIQAVCLCPRHVVLVEDQPFQKSRFKRLLEGDSAHKR